MTLEKCWEPSTLVEVKRLAEGSLDWFRVRHHIDKQGVYFSAFPAVFLTVYIYVQYRFLHIYNPYNPLKHQKSMCNFLSLKLLVTGVDCPTPAILKLCIRSTTWGSTMLDQQNYYCNQQRPKGNIHAIAQGLETGLSSSKHAMGVSELTGDLCSEIQDWSQVGESYLVF